MSSPGRAKLLIAMLASAAGAGCLLVMRRFQRSAHARTQKPLEPAEAQLREREAALSRLLRALWREHEAERAKWSRELHDELGSSLVSAKMDISWVLSRIRTSHPEAAGKLERALVALDEGIEGKRRVIDEMRPSVLDHLGLAAAIASHVTLLEQRGGPAYHLSMPQQNFQLPESIAIGLFRIVQQTLAVLVAQTGVGNVWIELREADNAIELQIRGDGPDWATQPAHRHLAESIRQRAQGIGGVMKIEAVPPGTNRVEVVVPLSEATNDGDASLIGPGT